jgi:hypothetical protein
MADGTVQAAAKDEGFTQDARWGRGGGFRRGEGRGFRRGEGRGFGRGEGRGRHHRAWWRFW